MNQLTEGCSAFYDGHGPVGLIPVRIDTIRSAKPEDTRPASWQEVRATITRDHGAYKKGEILTGWGLHFIPRGCVRRSSFYVRPYRVIAP